MQGVSTRRVSEIWEELFDGRVSHETVSRYVQQLDEELEPWRTRDLEGTEFPYLIVDARYEKARVDGRIVDVALLVAVGVDEDGYRQVLGVDTAYGETEQTWSDFPGGLRERGLSGVQLVGSDDHTGLGRARQEYFPGAPWQRCQRHFLQNAAGAGAGPAGGGAARAAPSGLGRAGDPRGGPGGDPVAGP